MFTAFKPRRKRLAGYNRRWNPAALWDFSNAVESVNGQLLALNGTDTSRIMSTVPLEASGIKVSNTSNLGRAVCSAPRSALDIGADDFTIFLIFKKDSNLGKSAFSRYYDAANSGSDFFLGAKANWFAATPCFSVTVGTTEYEATASMSWDTGNTYALIGRRRGTTVLVDTYCYDTKAWASGSATNAGITTVNYNAARDLKLGEMDVGATSNSVLTGFIGGTFKRSLTNAEVRDLATNPWQLLAPQATVLGIIPDLTNVSALPSINMALTANVPTVNDGYTASELPALTFAFTSNVPVVSNGAEFVSLIPSLNLAITANAPMAGSPPAIQTSFVSSTYDLSAFSVHTGLLSSDYDLLSFYVEHGAFPGYYDLLALTESTGLVDGTYVLQAYSEGKSAIDTAYDLKTARESIGFANSAYNLLALNELQSKLNAEYNITVLKQANGYADSTYSLLALSEKHAKLDAKYDITVAIQKAGYVHGAYGLLAFSGRQTTLDVAFNINTYLPKASNLDVAYDLLAYVSKANSVDITYNLQVYGVSSGYIDTTYQLSAYQGAIGYLDSIYDLLATEAFYAWAMNLTTGAISKFDNYAFNSLSGRLGANSDGIFELIGDTDNGALINGFVETGKLDFGDSNIKRVTDLYVGKEGGKVIASVDTGNTNYIPYTLRASAQLDNEKVHLAQGAKGRYWQFKLANTEGSIAKIDNVEVVVQQLSRKV